MSNISLLSYKRPEETKFCRINASQLVQTLDSSYEMSTEDL